MNAWLLAVLLSAPALQTDGRGVVAEPAPAAIVVHCQADDLVTFDDRPTSQTGTVRRFQTPPLPVGQRYAYALCISRAGVVIDQRRLEFQAGETVTVVAPAAANFGIDLEQLANAARPATLNGQPLTPAQVEQLFPETPWPDHGKKRRLTIIGSEAQRAAVLAELRGPLQTWAADYLVHDYPPDHWAVSRTGFRTDGQPTIYAQAPDGTVLFRQDDAVDLRVNLAAIRQPHPDYRPDRDPDHRPAAAGRGSSTLDDLGALLLLLAAGWALHAACHRQTSASTGDRGTRTS